MIMPWALFVPSSLWKRSRPLESSTAAGAAAEGSRGADEGADDNVDAGMVGVICLAPAPADCWACKLCVKIPARVNAASARTAVLFAFITFNLQKFNLAICASVQVKAR